MTLRLLISLSPLLFWWQNAGAQLAPADDFFNGGAQFYISNNIPAALERVESGLKIYPDDVKLKKLEQLLKQQQQQSRQNQKNQQNQSKQSQQKNQESQPQKSGGQQNQQPNQPNQPQPQNNPGENKQAQQASAMKGREMTPEEAKRLLDAQKGDEQFLQLKPRGKPEDQNRPIKDW